MDSNVHSIADFSLANNYPFDKINLSAITLLILTTPENDSFYYDEHHENHILKY